MPTPLNVQTISTYQQLPFPEFHQLEFCKADELVSAIKLTDLSESPAK
jgi:hypothetical protein